MSQPMKIPPMGGQQQQTAPTAPQRASRMTLAAISKGRKTDEPIRVVIHGVDGVGKTTFGANAPNPIFLGAEDGTSELDVARFPAPEAWPDVIDAVRTLTSEAHDFQTLVLDSLDWAEPLIWRHICEGARVKSIEEVGGGFGKGYTAALDEWRIFLAALEKLRREKRMHVILIAHTLLKVFKNPTGEDFERYQIKINDKAAGLVREWSDAVLFANYEVVAAKNEKTKRVRGVSTGARVLFTEHDAAWDAKNRYGLPSQIPLSWDDFFAAARAGQVAPAADLRAEIERKAERLPEELRAKVMETVAQSGDDVRRLAEINNRVNARLAELDAQEKSNAA